MITLSLTISAKMKCLRELVFSTLLRARDNSSLPMMPQPLTSGSRFSPSTKTAFNLSFSLEPLDTFQSLYYLNPSQYSALLSTPSLQKSFPLVSHTPHFLNFPSFSLVDFLIENCWCISSVLTGIHWASVANLSSFSINIFFVVSAFGVLFKTIFFTLGSQRYYSILSYFFTIRI